MNPPKYSEALLDEKFLGLEDKLDIYFDSHMTVLKSVEEQTKKTNGSVARTIEDIQLLKQWRTGLVYAYSVALLIIVPILALSLYRIWDTPQIDQADVQAAVVQALDNYKPENVK